MLVFADPGIGHVLGRIIHRAGLLKPFLIQRLVPELQAAVGQAAETVVEELVDRAGEHQPVGAHFVFDVRVLGRRADPDIVVVQHVLEHGGVAVERHRLERVCKIAVVGVHPGRHPRGHRTVQLGRVQPPLLAGVAAEK